MCVIHRAPKKNKLAVHPYLSLIRVTGAEPNPAGGTQDRLGQVTGPPQETHADWLFRFYTHFNKDF